VKKLSIVLIIVMLLFAANAAAADIYPDIEGSWAREAIKTLAGRGIFDGIYEGAFLPNHSVTREELIALAARCFDLASADQQTLYSWLDHLLPMAESETAEGDFATRAELVAVVGRLLGLANYGVDVENWYPTFDDIDRSHPLFAVVELANRLDLLPTYVINRFEPERLASRAETAAVLHAALSLDTVSGQIAEVHQGSNRIIVKTGDDQYRSLPVAADTLILAKGQNRKLDQITKGAHLQAFHDLQGNLALVNVESAVGTGNLLQGLAGLLKGMQETIAVPSLKLDNMNLDSLISKDTLAAIGEVLTPEQLMAIISGDWSGAGENFRASLFGQLVELGLTPWEVEAVLAQDWAALGDMGMDRVATLLSDYIGISPEIFYTAINQDWAKLYEYAQVEIAQRLLSALTM